MKYAIGLDIGGTSIKAALVAANGQIIKKHVVLTEAKRGKQKVLGNIFKAVSEVYSDKVVGIGVGCPGPFKDINKGIIGSTPNLPLHGVNLKKIIEQKFRKKVQIDNDANCYVLSEAIFGAAKGGRVVVGLTLGTGVGGGIVISGKIFHGRANAGELGHMFFSEKFQYYLAEKGVQRLCGNFKAKDSVELFKLAERNNKTAKEIWARYGKILAVLVVDLVNAFDPDYVVIGGGISKVWKHFSRPMFAEVKRLQIFPPGKIVQAKTTDSGILGAAQLVFNQ